MTLLPHTLSKRAHSTTLTPALGGRDARNSIRSWQSLFEIFEKSTPESAVLDPREDPEKVGQAIEKQPDHFRDRLTGFVQDEHAALRPTGDGP